MWYPICNTGRSFFPDGFLSPCMTMVGAVHYSDGTEMVCGRYKKNPLTFVKGLSVFKGEGFYPSTTLYLVPNKLIFLMLSMVKDCGFTLLSWGCLELSDFLTSKD